MILGKVSELVQRAVSLLLGDIGTGKDEYGRASRRINEILVNQARSFDLKPKDGQSEEDFASCLSLDDQGNLIYTDIVIRH